MVNKQASEEFVTQMLSLWPKSANYPMHVGYFVKIVIGNKANAKIYRFVTESEHFEQLEVLLQNYEGMELQEHIRELANMMRLFGVAKIRLLAIDILKAVKNVIEGKKFDLDTAALFAPPQSASEPTALKQV